MQGINQLGGKNQTQPPSLKQRGDAGVPQPARPGRRNWSSISMDEDADGVFSASADLEDQGSKLREPSEIRTRKQEEEAQEHQEAFNKEERSSNSRLPAHFEPDNPGADAARVSALLDARQVLGAASNLQEILSYLLIDHDLVRRSDEDPMVPAIDSPLWERLPEVPRRNVLHRLASFHAGSAAAGSCIAEFPTGSWSEVHLGRHRFPVASTDIQVLLKRWTLSEDPAPRATAMARVLALYRTLENPMLSGNQRSSHQLAWRSSYKKSADIEYEMFASPFNAIAANGKFASRWPHIESLFGSAGRYPDVIDLWPEDAVVGVNPPFSDAYLDHVFLHCLDRIVGRFKKVHIFAPVREAPWRSQLRRLKGATLVQDFWDATSMGERHLEQPVLYWQGSDLQDVNA
ncbi:unnamed protein product [Polarella glacialis]|uniref:PCIF1 WW domain-containing protein n=1 Tax=Polarella glacialis TaxID=89957 RepID=A0A813J6J6_POLGL|nr:unnamed protein product [Polarella glacialis]